MELGGGFGGQAIALAAVRGGGFRSYINIDIAESCLLATKHVHLSRELPATSALETDTLARFSCITSDMWSARTACDMFVSNYAVSELSAAVQKRIIHDVVASCQRGHIEANDISQHHGLAGRGTAELIQDLRDAGLHLVVRSLFSDQKSLHITVIDWGCAVPGCGYDVE